MKILILTPFFFLSSSFVASAVDLVNRDNGGYEIQITSTNGSTSTSVNALTIKSNICSSACEINVRGVGRIKASDKETVYIENGKLMKE
jgi:hypothetical protein